MGHEPAAAASGNTDVRRPRRRRARSVLLIARAICGTAGVDAAEGALNPGESSADAALREVREETGWACEVVRELEPVTTGSSATAGASGRRCAGTDASASESREHDHEVDEVLWTDPADARRACATSRTSS